MTDLLEGAPFAPPTGSPYNLPAPAAKRWQITWGDHVWTEDDLLSQHTALISVLSGQDLWANLDPDFTQPHGPQRLSWILTAFLAAADPTVDLAEIAAGIAATPVVDLANALAWID